METLTFSNNFGLSSDVRSERVIFIIKITDINNNVRNSKLRHGKITARINQLFNQFRTKIMALMLVSSSEVSNMVSVQKVKSFFLVGNQYLIIKGHIRTALIEFCESIKKDMEDLQGHKKRESENSAHYKKENYFLSDLVSFSRQVAITQAEKLVSSFFTCSSICSIKSWGKRISLRLVVFVSLAIVKLNLFVFEVRTVYTIKGYKKRIDLCGHNNIFCADRFDSKPYLNNSPMYWHTKGYLTKPLNEVMIMANRYDSAHLRAEQSKLYKFYDLSTAQVIETHHKKDLPNDFNMGYINYALAKSKVGICTSNVLLATHDAQSVFFCVNACAHLLKQSYSMVALAGQSKDWLVSSRASSANPVNVTAQEFCTSSGDYNNHLLEDANMATAPTTLLPNQKLFKFYDLSTAQVIETHHKKDLPNDFNMGYINYALAKSKVRIETLIHYSATHDALSVFFCVNANAYLLKQFYSMVALVGHPKGWLVSEYASSLNPVNVTAQEIETSSGDYLYNYSEAVTMTTTPNTLLSTQKLFKFYDLSTAQVIKTHHKKDLPNDFNMGYINYALAKSKVRIGTLIHYSATHDALSVFFCVNACRTY